jgi:hypothetical protein
MVNGDTMVALKTLKFYMHCVRKRIGQLKLVTHNKNKVLRGPSARFVPCVSC